MLLKLIRAVLIGILAFTLIDKPEAYLVGLLIVSCFILTDQIAKENDE